MNKFLFALGFGVIVVFAHYYYDLILKNGQIGRALDSFGYAGYWFVLGVPGILAAAFYIFAIPQKSKLIRILVASLMGALAVVFGLLGTTLWCIFRGLGICS